MEISPIKEEEIRYRVSRVTDLPPLPAALQRLVHIVQNELASFKELERIIRYDQGLSARVLRIANSSFYGCSGKINTLARALVLIGFEEARRICLCALFLDLFSSGAVLESAERERLWKEAFTTARVASVIARKRPWVTEEEAYLLGLLHDVGELVMALHFHSHYRAIEDMARHRGVASWYVEMDYGMSHCMIGKWVAIKWSLPEVFQRVIEFHHQPEKSPSYKSEAKLIHLANVLALSREHPELITDQRTMECCKDLFITEDEWISYQASMDVVWPEVDQFWNLLN